MFSDVLRRAITWARYCLYAGVWVLQLEHPPSAIFLYAPLAMPFVLHLVFRHAHTFVPNLAVHLVETVCLVFAISAIGEVGLLGQFAVVCTLLSGNAALFGQRWVGLFAFACIGAAFSANHEMPIVLVQHQPIAAGSVVWVLLFSVAIGLVAHKQAHVILRSGARIKGVNRSLMRYLPKEVLRHLQHIPQQMVERQWMTVTFVDLVGFTEAARRLPVESLSAVINDFFANVDQLVRDWGGGVSKFMGDGMLIVFCSEAIEERQNMARQCSYCVATLAELLHDLNIEWSRQGLLCKFSVTSGVASGYCSVGEWGGEERKDFTVIGTPVNLAARLQHHAQPSCALMDEVTAKLIGADRDPVEMDLKGLGLTTAFHIPPFK